MAGVTLISDAVDGLVRGEGGEGSCGGGAGFGVGGSQVVGRAP